MGVVGVSLVPGCHDRAAMWVCPPRFEGIRGDKLRPYYNSQSYTKCCLSAAPASPSSPAAPPAMQPSRKLGTTHALVPNHQDFSFQVLDDAQRAWHEKFVKLLIDLRSKAIQSTG